jgi:glc operon protein GlcG
MVINFRGYLMKYFSLISLSFVIFFSGSMFAQEAASLEAVVVSGDAAIRISTRTEISASVAEQIAKTCIARAEEEGVTVSIFILSPSGSIVYAHRMDGQMPIGVETALYKAETALYTRAPTHETANRFSTDVARVTRVKLDWYLVSGGLPIIVDNQIIGSIGVGGAARGFDEICAHYALTEVLGPQPPLTQD